MIGKAGGRVHFKSKHEYVKLGQQPATSPYVNHLVSFWPARPAGRPAPSSSRAATASGTVQPVQTLQVQADQTRTYHTISPLSKLAHRTKDKSGGSFL
jgi:hypothetical protein